jgi:hypothetical protein
MYFVASPGALLDTSAIKAKAAIEADREYARKLVLTETDLAGVLDTRPRERYRTSHIGWRRHGAGK